MWLVKGFFEKAQGTFRKILGSVIQNWISHNSTEGRELPVLPPKSAAVAKPEQKHECLANWKTEIYEKTVELDSCTKQIINLKVSSWKSWKQKI